MLLDPSAVTVEILTFKEGLLAAAGHDLVLRAERPQVEVGISPPSVDVTIDPREIHVLPAVHGLSPHDRAQIEKAMLADVLDAEHHPQIVFHSSRVLVEAERIVVEGDLSLVGHKRPIAFVLVSSGDVWEARIPIHQPDFGIRPYSAMLGALKVKADVEVHVVMPKQGLVR